MSRPNMFRDRDGNPVPVLGLGAAQLVDGTSASAQSTVISATEESVVRLAALGEVWVKVGTDPTAVSEEGSYIPQYGVEYITVPIGYKLAVIGAKLNITTCY